MKERDQDGVSPQDLRVGPALRPEPETKERSQHSKNRVLDLQHAVGNQGVMHLLSSVSKRAKLRLSQPGDTDEIEADRVADQVTSSSPPAIHSQNSVHTQAKARSKKDPPVGGDLSQSIGPGRPMELQVQEKMESAFGTGFDGVTIHIDSAAASSARSVNARAFTADQHIVFGSGEYAPDSRSGTSLLRS